jgi:hypothetical protein
MLRHGTKTVPAGSVSLSGDTVTVKAGYVSATTKKVTAGSVALNGNKVNVTEGYVKNETKTIPEASIEETSNKISIGVGYVSSSKEFEKSTSGGGSPPAAGGGSYVKITQYIPPHDAYSMVSQIVVTGFSKVMIYDEWEEDYTAWNGTYNATENTMSIDEQIFKHSTAEKYLYRIYDYDWGEWKWIFCSYLDAESIYSAAFYSDNLESGTWTNYEYDVSQSITLTKTTTNYPKQDLVLTAVTAVLNSDNTWSFGNNVSVNTYDLEPVKHCIYAYDSTNKKLIGKPICSYADMSHIPTEGLLMYFPLNNQGKSEYDCVNGLELHNIGKGVNWNSEAGYLENTGQKGSLIGMNTTFEYPKKFTISIKTTWSGNKGGSMASLIDFGTQQSDTGFGIRARTHYNDGKAWFGFRLGSNEDWFPVQNIEPNEEHTLTFTFDTDEDNYCCCYLDGEDWESEHFGWYSLNQAPSMEMFNRFIEWQTWSGEKYLGSARELLLYNRVLSLDEIRQLAQ